MIQSADGAPHLAYIGRRTLIEYASVPLAAIPKV